MRNCYDMGMQNPKNILITGASSGIGEALANYYAQDGVILFLSGRDAARLSEVKTACRAKGAQVETALVDVTDQEAMSNWITSSNEVAGLDLVIANAGISGGSAGRLDGEPISEARKIFDVNVTGVFNTVEPAIDIFKDVQHAKQIAVVASLAGFRGWPSAPSYTASKGAVRFYGEALRGSLVKSTNIQVNVICPGFVKSRMTDKNDFPMPFKMSADKAADIIARGLAKNRGRICFPIPVHFVSWVISILPDALAQKILAKSPAKGALTE